LSRVYCDALCKFHNSDMHLPVSRAAKVIILLLPLVIFLGIGEIYLRYKHGPIYKSRAQTLTRAEDPNLIYVFIPNKNGTNSRGYLDYEHQYEKPPGTFRIVIIGDSVAQGQGLKVEESFGRVLERTLNDLSAQNKFEVIVLARSGYSTSQELVLLEKEAFLYDPDLIIWSYVLNDPAHPVYHRAGYGRHFYKPNVYLAHLITKRLFLLAEKIKGRNCDKEYHEFLHCVYWYQVQASLNKIGTISKDRKTPVIFLIHPVFQKGKNYREYTLTALHKRLDELSSQTGLIPLDVLDAFRIYDPEEIKLRHEGGYDPWHPNAKGHAIIGNYLAKSLKDGGFIQ
jgi:lysophospholipase L1-like esterase